MPGGVGSLSAELYQRHVFDRVLCGHLRVNEWAVLPIDPCADMMRRNSIREDVISKLEGIVKEALLPSYNINYAFIQHGR